MKKLNELGFSIVELLFIILITGIIIGSNYNNPNREKNYKICDLLTSEIISASVISLTSKKKITIHTIDNYHLTISDDDKIIKKINTYPLQTNIKSSTINNTLNFYESGSASPAVTILKIKNDPICSISLSLYGRTRLVRL